ncbi:MAG TPA: GNAT family N-acetyltransferase [Anaerolineales bacterium]|nr:GNAT family N-acetyltransferase [Anaerolineales bacterium]
MPDVEIRRTVATDIPLLMAIDHTCQTDYVWQMDMQREEGQMGAFFREIRLPHPVKVRYPRSLAVLPDVWNRRSSMLTAMTGGEIVGYIRMSDLILPHTAWITDIVVSPRFRRQGVGMALMLAAQSWAVDRKNTRALVEMPSKNNLMVSLARKLGYEFCGYNDLYYETQDIALFFGRSIR